MITKEILHKIGEEQLKTYDDWIANNPQNLSIENLKEAVTWWKNQLKQDVEREQQIPTDDIITSVAAASNIIQSSILYGLVEGYYIAKLEKSLSKSKSSHKK